MKRLDNLSPHLGRIGCLGEWQKRLRPIIGDVFNSALYASPVFRIWGDIRDLINEEVE